MTLAQLPQVIADLPSKIVEGLKAHFAGELKLAQENADLKSKLASAEAANVLASAEVEKLTKALADKEAAISATAAEKAKVESEKADAIKAKEAAEAEVAAIKANPGKAAAEIVAKFGVKPGDRPAAESVALPKTMSREDFDKLTVAQKSEFSRNGGRIS